MQCEEGGMGALLMMGLKLYSMVEVYVLQGKSSKVLQNEGWKNQGVFVIFFLPRGRTPYIS